MGQGTLSSVCPHTLVLPKWPWAASSLPRPQFPHPSKEEAEPHAGPALSRSGWACMVGTWESAFLSSPLVMPLGPHFGGHHRRSFLGSGQNSVSDSVKEPQEDPATCSSPVVGVLSLADPGSGKAAREGCGSCLGPTCCSHWGSFHSWSITCRAQPGTDSSGVCVSHSQRDRSHSYDFGCLMCSCPPPGAGWASRVAPVAARTESPLPSARHQGLC